MAIRENELSRLRLALKTGEREDNSAIVRNRTYNRMRDNISDADVLAVATALAGLQAYELMGISRIDEAKVLPE
jgi:hypothetical protein